MITIAALTLWFTAMTLCLVVWLLHRVEAIEIKLCEMTNDDTEPVEP